MQLATVGKGNHYKHYLKGAKTETGILYMQIPARRRRRCACTAGGEFFLAKMEEIEAFFSSANQWTGVGSRDGVSY